MLTWLIIAPALAAVVVMLIPSKRSELHLPVGFALSFIPLAIAGVVFFDFESGEAGFQMVQRAVWYEPWGVSWYVGIDGISLGLVLLTAILFPISLAASTAIDRRIKEFVASVLFLEAALIGVFLALDLFLFFVFFEAVLVPMYLIIGIWGSERRVYAAVKFFLYTAFGSASISALAAQARAQLGGPTFAFTELLALDLPVSTERWLFAAFALAFAIKVPIFPFHTWLPDAHVEAPTAGSVLLAGVLLKLGTYGLLRFNLGL
ncbi:MAG: NADH-quinone oxidoreductase subunit M, partial [Acidimicrobiia bacterium]|nr:NADH-quinone oxidoreductase subunit M [Acidimicrobiia bacterium]